MSAGEEMPALARREAASKISASASPGKNMSESNDDKGRGMSIEYKPVIILPNIEVQFSRGKANMYESNRSGVRRSVFQFFSNSCQLRGTGRGASL